MSEQREGLFIEMQNWAPDQIACPNCGGWNAIETTLCGHCGGLATRVPRVLNRHGLYTPIPEGAVLVARPSRWGNPYTLTEHNREEALRLYREYANQRRAEDPSWLTPLRGKSLVCYCAPLPCHADILLELANE